MLTTAHTIATIVDVKLNHSTSIDTILVKVASRCNINCTYCYVYNMGDDNWKRLTKFISYETVRGLCHTLEIVARRQQDPYGIVLHGGEPFLLGSNKLGEFLESVRSVVPTNYPISIQSNGVLISDEILDVCSKYRATVAVSIDGPRHIHDRFRLSHNGGGTFDDVLHGIRVLQNHNDSEFLNAGYLAVIDPSSNPREVYRFFKEIKSPSVDFLYKDGNHDLMPQGKASLLSTEYGDWMLGLAEEYLSDPNPVPIRILDDLLKVLLGGIVSKEGIGLTDYGILIVDTDGTICKNDTLKSTFNGADRFENSVDVSGGEVTDFLSSREFLEYRMLQRPTHQDCLTCPLLGICGGGMLLHRYSQNNSFHNVSVYCSDQKKLIYGLMNMLSKLMND